MSSSITQFFENEFPQSYWRRGEQYFETGRVTTLRVVDEDGDHVRFNARIRGTHIYAVDVKLWQRRDDTFEIDGHCSCPIGFNCKHVVASLLKYVEQVESVKNNSDQTLDIEYTSIKEWMSKIESAITKPVEVAQPQSAQALIYLLDQKEEGSEHWVVNVLSGRQLKTGGYGKLIEFKIQRVFEHNIPSYVTEEDIEIISMLCTEQAHQIKLGVPPSSEVVLNSATSGDLIKKIVASNRSHWRDSLHTPLSLAEPIAAKLEWHLNTDGSQKLGFVTETPVDNIIAVCPPHYFHRESLAIGEVETPYKPELAQTFVSAPDIPPEYTDVARDDLDKRIDEYPVPVPLPQNVQLSEVETPACIPVMDLDLAYIVLPHAWTRDAMGIPVVRLKFDYQGSVTHYGAKGDRVTEWRDKQGVVFNRDKDIEAGFIAALEHHGLRPLKEALPTRIPDNEQDAFVSSPLGANPTFWGEFMERAVPQLRAQGWKINVKDVFPYNVVEWEEWYLDVETSGVDWFGADLGIVVDGEKINLLPILADLISRGQLDLTQPESSANVADILIPIDHKRRVRLPGERIRTILTTLFELYEPKSLEADGTMVLSRAQAFRLATLDGNWHGKDLQWTGGESIRGAANQLAESQGLKPYEPPPGSDVSLRPYQRFGVSWLQFLREHGLAGILADDMGLGKTVQTIIHLAIEYHEGRLDKPALIVMPTSLISNWQREFKRFYPKMNVLVIHGPERKKLFDDVEDADVVLTTYPLITRDAEFWTGFDFHYIILDEAQYIKNPRAQVTQTITKLTSRHKLCLSGTPMENHLGELWSQFNFLMPGYLSKFPRFKKLFQSPIEKFGDNERRLQLQRRVKPFVLRRTKDQVVAELPKKTDIVRAVKMESGQRDLYESVRLAMHQKVQSAVNEKGFSQSKMVILDALLKLRQVCCDPRLVKFGNIKSVKQSAKLNYLLDLIPNLVEEGRSILIFSQFTSMLALIEQELKRIKIDYVKLTGQTKDRETPVLRFQAAEVPVFLISLKAGGTGLNLTQADTVIHYDPWWNPAVEAQATDRAHRIGQKRAVFNYKFICEGSVEEKILELQAKKKKLVEGMYSETLGEDLQFSEQDFNELFEPLG